MLIEVSCPSGLYSSKWVTTDRIVKAEKAGCWYVQWADKNGKIIDYVVINGVQFETFILGCKVG